VRLHSSSFFSTHLEPLLTPGFLSFLSDSPQDYRNAIKWYQYDPTKWFIVTMSTFGLASHLKAFPSNEIKKGQYTMQLKKLEEASKEMKWPVSNDHLPVVSWEDCTLPTFLSHSTTFGLVLTLPFPSLSALQSRRSPSLDL
jgi:hypothetical protein